MKIQPKFKENFRDLPPIPEAKKWTGSNWTPEQDITRRMIQKEDVSDDDLKTLSCAIDFYGHLIPKIRDVKVGELSEKDFEDFVGYFQYAFNHILMVRNDLHVTGFFRLVQNSAVPNAKGKIRYQKYLSYPPLDLVKKSKRYNRANTPDFNLFYATDSFDSALLELKPDVGDIVTVGTWVPKQGKTILTSYPVTHNPLTAQVNPEAKKGYLAFQEIKQYNHPTLMKFMETIFGFVSEEFAKPVKDHWEYFLSAKFSERILKINNAESEWNYECMVYPSVGNKYSVNNIALRPEIIDAKFNLARASQFRITKTMYESVAPRNHPEEITVVNYDDFLQTDWIDDGYIVWD